MNSAYSPLRGLSVLSLISRCIVALPCSFVALTSFPDSAPCAIRWFGRVASVVLVQTTSTMAAKKLAFSAP